MKKQAAEGAVKVKINCQWDNGEEVLQPGHEMELERDLAHSLANMGMVEVLTDKKQAEPAKPSTATKARAKVAKKAKAADAGDDTGGDIDPDKVVE